MQTNRMIQLTHRHCRYRAARSPQADTTLPFILGDLDEYSSSYRPSPEVSVLPGSRLSSERVASQGSIRERRRESKAEEGGQGKSQGREGEAQSSVDWRGGLVRCGGRSAISWPINFTSCDREHWRGGQCAPSRSSRSHGIGLRERTHCTLTKSPLTPSSHTSHTADPSHTSLIPCSRSRVHGRDRALLDTFTALHERGYRIGLGPRFGGEYLVYPGKPALLSGHACIVLKLYCRRLPPVPCPFHLSNLDR